MILKNKITRSIAFLMSCIMVAVCASRVVEIANETSAFYNTEDIYSKYYEVTDEMNEMYGRLWSVGVMYLRNLDENGNFTGSEELKNQTVKALQKLGCMNENGEIEIKNEKGLKYKVAYGDNSFEYESDLFKEENQQYSMGRKNDEMFYSSLLTSYHYSVYDFNWYQTNYGMTYYEMPYKCCALYDYDTTGMYSVQDSRGATLYFRLDGSTPIPREYLRKSDEQIYVEDISKVINGDFVLVENGDESITTTAPINTEPVTETTAASTDTETDATTALQSEAPNTTPEIVTETLRNYNDYEDGYEYDYPEEYGYDEPVRETIDMPLEQSGFYYYNNDDRYLYRVNTFNDGFTKELGEEYSLEITIQPDDKTIADFLEYRQFIRDTEKAAVQKMVNLIPLAIVALILMLFVLITGGYNVKEKKFTMSWREKIFAELPIALIILLFTSVFVMECEGMYYEVLGFCKEFYTRDAVPTIYGLFYGTLFGVIVLMLDTLIIRLKCRSFWKSTLLVTLILEVYRIVKKIRMRMAEYTIKRDMLKNDRFIINFLIRTVFFVIVECFWIFISMAFNSFESCVMLLFVSIILLTGYVLLSLFDLKAMTDITKHVSDMNGGNYKKQTVSKLSPAYTCNEKLNNISAGIQTAVDRQIRSERMKIDLVTNVSHDLKTPLTSIISYIDLLSAEELTPEAQDYVKIIAEKSERLKLMVADLFDLAKATSRTDVKSEQIDAVILTGQVIGDLADKIENSGKEIRTDIKMESAPIMAEGKKLYRVFQNLIDNALKYSMNGTRIYVILRKDWNKCVIMVKNIASYEMNFTPDEITERFTRGDESRSTEGNGLGLSIAKSFTEACGGTFRIIIDGDVFTAEMSFPLINDTPKAPNAPLPEEKK